MKSDRKGTKHLVFALAALGAIAVACNLDRRMIGDAGRVLLDAGSDDASAQTAPPCTRWEVRYHAPAWCDPSGGCDYDRLDEPQAVAEGWEPFGFSAPYVALRRCVR